MAAATSTDKVRANLDQQDKHWWVVSGKQIKGPFDFYVDAKASVGLSSDAHNDEIIRSGLLYRYGAIFIGTATELHTRKISDVPWKRGGHDKPAAPITVVAITPMIGAAGSPSTDTVRIDLSNGRSFFIRTFPTPEK